MSKNKQLKWLLQTMESNGFRQRLKYGAILIELHRLHEDPQYIAYRLYLALVRDWLVVPYSFWPVDFPGLGKFMCDELKAGRPLDKKLIFLLDLVREFPAEAAQVIVRLHEHNVRIGEYRQFVRCNAKYEAYARKIEKNQKLRQEWEELKSLYGDYIRQEGVVRRRMVMERNFKTADWWFHWDTEQEKFQNAMDAFCHRWDLYGMENDKPLVLKLTVNVTAFGTLIMIPKYMSPDFVRDLNTPVITEFHKARGASRMSEKRRDALQQREEEARRTNCVNKESLKLGLKGEKRRLYIVQRAGLLPDTDWRKIRHLITQGAESLREEAEDVSTPSTKKTKGISAATASTVDRLEEAKAAVNALSAEERQTFLEWMR